MALNKLRQPKKLILSNNVVQRFWTTEDPEILAPVLQEMDSKENWTKISRDGAVKKFLNEFTKIIASEQTLDKDICKCADNILTITAYLSSSWSFRFLKWLDDYKNPVLNKLTITAMINSEQYSDYNEEYMSPSELYIDRMIAVKQLSLLSKIFSPEREQMINTLLQKAENEYYAQGK